MKAYVKLTVVMCCQIFARKSVAPSSGNFWRQPAPRYICGQDQEFWRKKFLKNNYYTASAFRQCVTGLIRLERGPWFAWAGLVRLRNSLLSGQKNCPDKLILSIWPLIFCTYFRFFFYKFLWLLRALIFTSCPKTLKQVTKHSTLTFIS